MLPVQCKMARVALGLGVRELATLSAVSTDTIARLERGEELKPRTLEAIRSALEAAGVEFTNGGQPGVRMNKEILRLTTENAELGSKITAVMNVNGVPESVRIAIDKIAVEAQFSHGVDETLPNLRARQENLKRRKRFLIDARVASDNDFE